MQKCISTGEMIDSLLANPTLRFVDSNNEFTSYMDSYNCIVFQKFEGHRVTTIMLEDRDKTWTVKAEEAITDTVTA